MKTPDTGLDLISKRIFAALLKQIEEEQLTGWRSLFAKTTLWYYQSPLALLPDFLPGIGYIDNFCISQLALWICSTNPDVVESEELENFDIRCRQYLQKEDQPILSTDTAQDS